MLREVQAGPTLGTSDQAGIAGRQTRRAVIGYDRTATPHEVAASRLSFPLCVLPFRGRVSVGQVSVRSHGHEVFDCPWMCASA